MNSKLVSAKANAVLEKFPDISLPVNIEDMARVQGLKVMPYPLDSDVSGVLVIEADGNGIIGYNQNESRVRRRFTIAHELGHYELHRHIAPMFIDKDFKQFTIYRSQDSSSDISKKEYEREANAFAAEILMPADWIKKELEKTKIDLGSEDGLKELAKTFDVSSTAMYYRLTKLELI